MFAVLVWWAHSQVLTHLECHIYPISNFIQLTNTKQCKCTYKHHYRGITYNIISTTTELYNKLQHEHNDH